MNFNSIQEKKRLRLEHQQIISNDIVINEFMADNGTTITDPAGEYDDWIELYNPTSNPIIFNRKIFN